jgi:hypothetical protein
VSTRGENSIRSQAASSHAMPAPALLKPDVSVEEGMLRVCCGNLIQPRLGEVRDPVGGRTVFVTCWRCPTCGRLRLR